MFPDPALLIFQQRSVHLFPLCLLALLECKLQRAGICSCSVPSPACISSAYNRRHDECLLNVEKTLRTKIFSVFTFRRHPIVLFTFFNFFGNSNNNNNKQPFSIGFPLLKFKISQLIFQRHWPNYLGGRGDNLGFRN